MSIHGRADNQDVRQILDDSAKDLGTGKEQKIQITGSSNLNEKELEQMNF